MRNPTMTISTTFRPPSITEAHALAFLDSQCFYDAWDHELWHHCITNYFCKVVTHQNKVIGAIVATAVDDQPTQFRIMKLLVRGPHRPYEPGEILLHQRKQYDAPGILNYRRRGLSRQLLAYVVQTARTNAEMKSVDCWVPENFIFPTENLWCIREWLGKLGFKHVETKTEMFTNQGYMEDGQRWELPLIF